MKLRLASSSAIRRSLLESAGLDVEVVPARVDEDSVKTALIAEGARPREVADALAELKARKVGERHPEGLTLGADQVLDLDRSCLGKPETPQDAKAMLRAMSGKTHTLHSAAVVYEDAKPIWRHIAPARMQVRELSDSFIDRYVSAEWEQIRHSAGAYQVEGAGIRLFSSIGTDYHAILGLPLMQLLNWLHLRGDLTT